MEFDTIYDPMIQACITTGNENFDAFLGGGYEQGIITTLYGPAASGKTTLCMLATIAMARENKKVIYIDTEGGFSITRFEQLGGMDILDRVLLISPTTFPEQHNVIKSLYELMNNSIAGIIVDTISMQYRLALSQSKTKKEINDCLGEQISKLTNIARKFQVPVIITNQVYSDFDLRDQVRMVGGDLLLYGSKCLIELEKKLNHRIAKIKKHRFIQENKNFVFSIIEEGIEEKQQ